MLSEHTIQVVKSTIPLIEGASDILTDHFYRRMFLHNPELQDVFNMSHQRSGRQRAALYDAIAGYAKNIENLEVLKGAVERIAHKHSSFGIQPEQYDIVGHHLIETLRELTGEAFTPEVETAWVEAYGLLANIFIQREESIYQQGEDDTGGWRGKRVFRLREKRSESKLVKSFVFEPVDGAPVMDFLPGQYLGLEVKPSKSENIEIRQYSLSGRSDGRRYQISVKREGMDHPGMVSNYLHDELQTGDEVIIRPPCGDFHFVDRQAPTVLISAGVGLTPMQSMLETLYEHQVGQGLSYLHACNHAGEHSFKDAVSDILGSAHGKQWGWQGHVWYLEGEERAENNSACSVDGFQCHSNMMDLSSVRDDLHLESAHFYVCGPVPFMAFVKQQLLDLGVEEERVHYEVFGPHESL
ncbi:NO-inducible flavohemoprotein [Pseudoteredinibacter isoporae]|uniref:Flavohemoprotein n=1 Tax=Pseudoteredinibacter isoporae TaxID=570281 RepID=A0A7X0JUX8_9GAMM|nr:NO-inducible flavohemoprotein [Pseudoteredinibacter isoporae]MBB6521890.1 nitric oxide dioxygenase [Pseudoteredinibacter isoporae]NHO87434.1 NO-inducible flavohemoprotein [Pseudoteredinibacter isoporae]NIB24235.1 NO-inducible flavohemoprotein [Pseudoteredinibacter isoporae]